MALARGYHEYKRDIERMRERIEHVEADVRKAGRALPPERRTLLDGLREQYAEAKRAVEALPEMLGKEAEGAKRVVEASWRQMRRDLERLENGPEEEDAR